MQDGARFRELLQSDREIGEGGGGGGGGGSKQRPFFS